MRKITAALLISLCCATSLCAYTDSFSDNNGKAVYEDLIQAVKDNEAPSVVEPLYEAYRAAESDPVDLARTEYHVARYYKDRGDDAAASSHVAQAWDDYANISETGVRKELTEANLYSVEYYVNGGMGNGMKSSSLTKDLYKAYPEEIAVILLEANRLLYSPHIGGGSPKRGLALFETLLPVADQIQTIDRFDLYSGLGVASYERNKDADAVRYLDMAMDIYTGDKVVNETLAELT